MPAISAPSTSQRLKADTRASFEAYLSIVNQKVEQYKVFCRRHVQHGGEGLSYWLQKSRRIFTKDLHKQSTLLGTGQDGSRELVTVVATICADGTSLSPALTYKASSGNLQDT